MPLFTTLRRAIQTATPVLALGTAALTAVLAACSDSPTGPASAGPTAARALAQGPSHSTSTTTSTTTSPTTVQSLRRTAPLAQTVVVTKYLSSGGGGIDIPGTDLQLQVPSGAIPGGGGMTFTITAYAGSVVAYDFQPHGTVFLKPLTAVQQLGHTNWTNLGLPAGSYPTMHGNYFANASQINFSTGQSVVNEVMPSTLNVSGATMTWSVPHFSGYLVSWNRGGN